MCEESEVCNYIVILKIKKTKTMIYVQREDRIAFLPS